MRPNPQFPVDLVTFTEEILHEKLYFLQWVSCSRFLKDHICHWSRGILNYESLLYKAPT